jgi:hypothetical protein
MRGPWARRLRDVFDLHLSDLGGPDGVSEAERSIVRRAAAITVELERIEARFAVGKGSDDDLDLYQRTAGNLRRLLESVGLERRPRDLTPTLAEYLHTKAAKSPAGVFSRDAVAEMAPDCDGHIPALPNDEGGRA